MTGVSESDLSTLQGQRLVEPRIPLASPDASLDLSDDLENLFGLRVQYHNHPLIGFLNINSLRHKIVDLRVIVEKFLPDILVIEETKLNSEFKMKTFLMNNYQTPMRRDRNEFGGGLMQYVRKGVVCSRVPLFEVASLELICSELTVNKKKWIIYSIYRPPEPRDLDSFFSALSISLNSALDKYDNVILMGDININTFDKEDGANQKLVNFCDVFGLSNLVTAKTCFTKTSSSSIDVILTNRVRSFQKTSVFETGLSDYHGLVVTVLKSHIPRLKPKVIKYRNYKNFDPVKFIADVRRTNFDALEDPEDCYNNLTNNFRNLVDKHAPLKTKFARGNSAPFVTRELKKAIYTRTRLKNKFNKFPTNLNERNYKKQRNKCVSLRKKAIKQHFKKATAGGLISNSDFWNLVKPFLSNKGGLVGDDISLVHNNQIVTDDSELTEIFNNHYINIVEKTSGQKPCNISDTVKYDDDRLLVRLILEKYKDHPSVLAIREGSDTSNSFSFHEVQHHEVWALLRSLDGKKSTGEDQIPPKLVHLAADELTAPLTFAINSCLQNQRFPDKGKRAAVCPLDKGEENRTAEKNFRPVSVLNTFSKIYEKVMKQQLVVYLDTTLSVFIGAYRKAYGTQHVLIRLLEDWKTKLDNNYIVGALLMDLSKAFDCIPHDLLIAKLNAYGADENALVLIYSYLKRRKQSVRINNTYSSFQTILSGVPQGSVLGPILFNVYLNDLFLFIKQATLYNYADDNTLACFSKTLPDLVRALEAEAGVALDWLKENYMIANPSKFHALLIKKDQTTTSGERISIQGKTIKSEDSVKLLGIQLDYKLNFDPHISALCKKAATQLNVLKRLRAYIGFDARKVLVQSFVYSNFNYCPLVWHFCSAKSMHKIEKVQERALRFLHNDHASSYNDLLLKSQRCTMHVHRLRAISIELFKTLNGLNPSFMKDIFQVRSSNYSSRNPNNLAHYRPNQVTFGTHSLKFLGPQIWNCLPNELKSAESLNTFKRLIAQWDGPMCNCNACRFTVNNVQTV